MLWYHQYIIRTVLQCAVSDQAITIKVYDVLSAAGPVLLETLTFNRK
ncbi:MAG: hypothetical protein IKB16_13215 [Lentisphaeria bacterium]|nr:hypothetical protein [Lentisphaeria bacterium]